MSTAAQSQRQQQHSTPTTYRKNNYHRTERPNGNFHRNRDYRPRYSDHHHHHQSRPYRRGNNYHDGQAVPGSFFLGNVDKQLTREQVYDFIKNETNCYITKFDMPNVPGNETDKEGRPIKCAGFAFVHVKHQWMANEMLGQGKIRIGNLEAEIKPYDQMKREMSERRYRNQSMGSQHREIINENVNFEEEKENINQNNNENVVANHLSTPRNSGDGKVDWAEETNGNYNPNDYATKLGQIGIGDYYVEDDSVYQTEDETASVLSAVNVNIMEPSSNFSSRPNSRLASPPNGRRRPKMPVNIPQNETEIVGEITQKLLNEGITPTANTINQIASKDYNITANIVELKGEKRESQETLVVTGSSPNNNNNISNNHIIQTPISVGVPNLSHGSFVIPAASLPYIQSPLHQTMELLANRLTSLDEYSAALYATLVEQWTQYYANHPQEILHHLQRNQFEQEAMMNQSAVDILRQQQQIPLETQHII